MVKADAVKYIVLEGLAGPIFEIKKEENASLLPEGRRPLDKLLRRRVPS
jgi:hypothetical protein